MQTLTIGRSASNNIVLTDEMVSRHHAELIVLDNGQVILKDLRSSNGTFVNGNKIKECYLKPGDIVKCATTFLKWSQYVTSGPQIPQSPEPVAPQPGPNVVLNDFNLNMALKYVSTRIFSVGDLFMKEWNMVPSIIFFLLTPLVLIFICCLIVFAKFPTNFAQIVVLPVILSIFLFGVPQFLTLSLISIGKETNFTKNLFASSIFSFLQFSYFIVIGMAILVVYLFSGGFENISPFSDSGFPILMIIAYLLAISVITSITVTLWIFVYEFFKVIGVTKGVSIHLTILSFAINGILMVLFLYAYLALILKNNNPFDSLF